jgi:undecaprenyl-diphosphatase
MIESGVVFFLNTNGVLLLYLITAAYVWFYEKKQEEVKHILFAAIITSIVAITLKELIDLPRPYMTNGKDALAGYVSYGSFPSLHTALAFSLSTTVILHQKRLGILLFLVAAVIGMGRIAANVHYPLDVVSGAILGTLVSLMLENIHFKNHRLDR